MSGISSAPSDLALDVLVGSSVALRTSTAAHGLSSHSSVSSPYRSRRGGAGPAVEPHGRDVAAGLPASATTSSSSRRSRKSAMARRNGALSSASKTRTGFAGLLGEPFTPALALPGRDEAAPLAPAPTAVSRAREWPEPSQQIGETARETRPGASPRSALALRHTFLRTGGAAHRFNAPDLSSRYGPGRHIPPPAGSNKATSRTTDPASRRTMEGGMPERSGGVPLQARRRGW